MTLKATMRKPKKSSNMSNERFQQRNEKFDEPKLEVIFFSSGECKYCSDFESQVWNNIIKGSSSSPFNKDDDVEFYHLNVEQGDKREIALKHNILKVPTLAVAKNGYPLINVIGVPNVKDTVAFIRFFQDKANYANFTEKEAQALKEYQYGGGST